MSTVFLAHFDGKVLVPDVPVSLPIGEKLEVRVESTTTQTGQFADLANFAADLPESPGDLAAQHDHYLYRPAAAHSLAPATAPLAGLAALATSQPANPNSPSDLAAQHDHYLYGAAKRQ